MGNATRKRTTTRKKPQISKDPPKKRTRKPKGTAPNTHERNNKVADSVASTVTADEPKVNEVDNDNQHYKNFFRLLQLFPNLHANAIERIFISCNRDLLRTIDNLLYVKRYAYKLHNHDCISRPSTPTRVDQPQHVNTTNNFTTNRNIDCSPPEMLNNYAYQYIPNGTMDGINEQIRTYGLEHYTTGPGYSHGFEVEMQQLMFQTPVYNNRAAYNISTLAPGLNEPTYFNINAEKCIFQLGNIY